MKENLEKCLAYVELMQQKHSLVCYSLEIGQSWDNIISKWFNFNENDSTL